MLAVHADKLDGAGPGDPRGLLQASGEKADAFGARHLTRREGEFSVLDAPAPAYAAHWHIVRQVKEGGCSLLVITNIAHQEAQVRAAAPLAGNSLELPQKPVCSAGQLDIELSYAS